MRYDLEPASSLQSLSIEKTYGVVLKNLASLVVLILILVIFNFFLIR